MAIETPSPQARADLAPTGRLRAAINVGNQLLVQQDKGTGALSGITLDLAHELGRRLGVPVDLVVFKTAGHAFDAFRKGGELDIAFLALDAERAQDIQFTAPYLLVEGSFVAVNGASLNAAALDHPGARISVAGGSAYDLFLMRNMRYAELVRLTTGADAFESFARDGLTASAGIKPVLAKLIKDRPTLQIVEPPFMTIEQALVTRIGNKAGTAYARAFIEDVKANGFVADAIRRSGQDAAVAPPAS